MTRPVLSITPGGYVVADGVRETDPWPTEDQAIAAYHRLLRAEILVRQCLLATVERRQMRFSSRSESFAVYLIRRRAEQLLEAKRKAENGKVKS